ncbi:cdc42-interacting protein 4 homolog isoform X2 [Boleophthalmus pectinirostris]|uniref:cdc42-interacting protein 4 homolog isoform X2 n=1 Tax=Boleophthalmus pectinirostris TaxID=150288 RepID=UPI0024306E07|nr:cdc42-interacting protein 4 homolog isoform X2 [Boleophthalmus pectinirostris]
MDWGTDLWDQNDVIDKHTQSGLDLVERYVKFVKERSEIEQNYAKQLRNLTKKYKKGSKEEQECKFSNHASFQDILSELNDYAGQREVVAENMMTSICVELTKFLQEIKQERKTHLSDVKKAQQTLESSFKQLESTKKRFAKEWAEAEKATQQAEKTENDLNATRLDVEKAKHYAHTRTHIAEESRSDYAAQLQKYNKEQNYHYYTDIPQIFNKLQDMDERRIRRLAEGYCQFSEIEKNVLPIVTKCLDCIYTAGTRINANQDSILFIEQHKSGFERPSDVDFEDYSHGIKPATSESTLNAPKHKAKLWLFSKKKPVESEDFSHLPPEQRKKKLQAKIDEITKELQKAQDSSEALEKMKVVYANNPGLGDPSSLEPSISETAQKIGKLRGEIAKYETWLLEAMGGEDSSSPDSHQHNVNTDHLPEPPEFPDPPEESTPTVGLYTDFSEFDDVCGQYTVLYAFEGKDEGTLSISPGEQLSAIEEDQGDGWMRVVKANGEEGYIPSSYVQPL